MKRIIILLVLAFSGLRVNANSYLYMLLMSENLYMFNPAYTGLSSNHINIFGQRQWMGIREAPQLYSVNAHGRIGTFNFYNPTMMLNKTKFKSAGNAGIGMNIFAEKQGAYTTTGTNLTYGYHIAKDDKLFSFGLLVNYSIFSLNVNDLNPASPDDPLLQGSQHRDDYFNAGAGFTYSSKNITIGLGYMHFLDNYLDDNLGLNFYYQDGKRFNFHTSYIKEFKDIEIKPYMAVSCSTNYLLYIIGSEIDYKNKLTFSLNYQSFRAIGLSISHSFPRMYIKYYTNFPVGRNTIRTYGSYGISIGRILVF
ncbi:MAG: PorP/SprF family type IX secretion system membrane protein [Bacteroidales bacterium]|nr:PorP/SprF family type IX secretion system membrane protein [Bacteroidales bacterium]